MTIKTMIFANCLHVSLDRFTFCRWSHNQLLMTSQWPDNCDAITGKMIFNSLDIDFIHGDIHDRSCNFIFIHKLYLFFSKILFYSLPIMALTHCGLVTQYMASLTGDIIGLCNGQSSVLCQTSTCTDADSLSIDSLHTNLHTNSYIWIKTRTFPSKKCIWKCRLRNVGHFFATPATVLYCTR